MPKKFLSVYLIQHVMFRNPSNVLRYQRDTLRNTNGLAFPIRGIHLSLSDVILSANTVALFLAGYIITLCPVEAAHYSTSDGELFIT